MDQQAIQPNTPVPPTKSALHKSKSVSVMHRISRYVQIVGVIIVFLALLYAGIQKKAEMNREEYAIFAPSPQPSISIEPTLIPIPIDLNGPLSCDYSAPEATVSATILQKQIYVTTKESSQGSYLLVKDDCVYTWKDNDGVGKKSCDVKQALSAAEMLAAVGALKLDTIVSAVSMQSNSELLKDREQINKVLATCKKEATNSAVFTIPQNITFTESTEKISL